MTINEYNQCIDKYADNIYRFILKNIKNKENAEDIMQDVFEKLWLKLENVSFDKSKTYLFTAAYHTMIDLIRKERFTHPIESIHYSFPEKNSQYSDKGEILHAAIDRLPSSQKMVILLRDYEGYSYKEISEITNLTEEQVKVYIYRGRLFLRKYIGKPEVIL